MMEQCALIISANESYERGEKDLEKFTGIPVSHSTLYQIWVSYPRYDGKLQIREVANPQNCLMNSTVRRARAIE